MSEFQQYSDSFASRFATDEFNFLSPSQQEDQVDKNIEEQHIGTGAVSGGENMGDEGLIHGESYEDGSSNEDRRRGDGAGSSANQSSNSDGKKSSKPKRTRATGETLDFLKQEFDLNPNPTTQRRKKISELTGLPEKNVRIWFQNRRAKLRKSGGQPKSGTGNAIESGSGGSAPEEINECATYFDRIPLKINNNYYFTDICSITVGSWNRMKSGALRRENLPMIRDLSNLSPNSINQIMSNATDLMVLISKKNSEINYFFSAMANNTKILFRIFFAISSVVNCSLTLETEDITEAGGEGDNDEEHDMNEKNGPIGGRLESLAELKLAVSRPPNFAVFFLDNSEEGNGNQWSICEDFSEGRQVHDAFVGGSNMPHALKGSESSLKFMNSLILDYNSTNQILPPPPTNSHNPHMAGPQPLPLHEQHPHGFFDQYDAANDILALNRDASALDEHKNRLNDERNAGATDDKLDESSANLLSLSHEAHIPNMPDFFKNAQELADDHRWL